jgi:hypothetical protein
MAIPQIGLFLQGTLITVWVSRFRMPPVPKLHPGAFSFPFPPLTFVGIMVVFVLVSIILGALAYGAVTSQVSEIQFGRSLTIRESYRLPLQRMGSLVVLILLILLLVLAGAITR